MTIIADYEIVNYVKEQEMISPFESSLIREKEGKKIVSYGLTSYGYDARLADEFIIFDRKDDHVIIDPKSFDVNATKKFKSDVCIIPPHGFMLSYTIEYFKMPREILGICLGKSTYARCGISINVTPIEPEWQGQIVLEFSNTTPMPVKMYAGEGACQFIFLKADNTCQISYKDRGGKYQNQTGITLPRI